MPVPRHYRFHDTYGLGIFQDKGYWVDDGYISCNMQSANSIVQVEGDIDIR